MYLTENLSGSGHCSTLEDCAVKFDPIGTSQTRLTVSLAELVGAFSYALDITEGQPAGHGVRVCWIGSQSAAPSGSTRRTATIYIIRCCSKTSAAEQCGAHLRAVPGRRSRLQTGL